MRSRRAGRRRCLTCCDKRSRSSARPSSPTAAARRNSVTLEAAYIRRLSEVEAVARLLAADLATRGLTTEHGRVRGTFSRWLECLDRWDRLAQRVGTDRRARGLSLTQRLAAAPLDNDRDGRNDAEGE